LLAYSVYPEAVNCDTDEAASYNHQSENVQQPDLHSCSPFARELQAELGVAASSSYLVKRFPPELYYHLVEHCSLRTISKLCCLSSTIRAIVSPVLYKTMIVSSPDQLSPFSGNDDDVSVFVSGVNSTMLEHRPPGFLFLPLSALLSQNPLALTLDRVLTLHLSIRRGDHLLHHTVELDTYPIIPLPNLRHLQLISSHENHFFDFDRSNPDQFQDLCDFETSSLSSTPPLLPSPVLTSISYFAIGAPFRFPNRPGERSRRPGLASPPSRSSTALGSCFTTRSPGRPPCHLSTYRNNADPSLYRGRSPISARLIAISKCLPYFDIRPTCS
jgi:hypothetical protein